jgi:hypothetical protein
MTELNIFFQLKKSVLEQYQKSYPYFVGNWKTFSSQDILNLMDDILLKTKQSVSEKWIYTHLKPETNKKLPRKDMLDILSIYIGKSGWDEFKFDNNLNIDLKNKKNKINTKFHKKAYVIIGVLGLMLLSFLLWKNFKIEKPKINLKNTYTNETINKNEVKAYVIEDAVEKQIEFENGKINVEEKTKVIIKSPFYKSKVISVEPNSVEQIIDLNPKDYAMMLKAFMKSDIKDWETRKIQLNKILSDNLEVMIMLQNNLGAEYFNKTEFSQKLIVPSKAIKKMKIVELKQEADNKISFLRITE